MTIPEIVKQIWEISNKQITTLDNQKFTSKKSLVSNIRMQFIDKEIAFLKIGLPDGKWHMFIDSWGTDLNCFDYYIPDNRQQEIKIVHDLQMYD